jgi:predicted dehydrogenase
MGHKRAAALAPDPLVGCYDVATARARALAAEHGGEAVESYEALLELEPEVVIVAVTHDRLAELSQTALEAGAHVLVEKPAGLGVADVDRVDAAARRMGRLVKVGFNHRFHPGIARAVDEARSGRFGEVMFVRGRYGHGGRPGYEQEWRAQPALSGGGELVDQGMHLLDLSHAILGPLPLHSALLRTQFWDTEVEDNAALILGEPDRRDAPWSMLHASWTEWKNMFSLEVYCRAAKLAVDGLVASYGPQRLRIYAMRPELGPPDIEEIEYPDRDGSWAAEWAHFRTAIRGGGEATLLGDLESARWAWTCVEEAYVRTRHPLARTPA